MHVSAQYDIRVTFLVNLDALDISNWFNVPVNPSSIKRCKSEVVFNKTVGRDKNMDDGVEKSRKGQATALTMLALI